MRKMTIEEIIIEALESTSCSGTDRSSQDSTSSDQEMMNSQVVNFDGSVKVEDGRIIVKNPVGFGKYPTISPSLGINVYVNGKALKDIDIVTDESQLEVIIEQDQPYSDFDILLSEDELEAYCTVNLISGRIYRLANHSESNHVVLQREAVEEVYPQAINLEEVKVRLLKMGINNGVFLDRLESELKNFTGKPVLVAQGIPPVPSQDPQVEYLFQTGERTNGSCHDGRIDYLERMQYPSVEVGTVLAVKHPPVMGKAGLTVKGVEIPVAPINDISINIGQGVTLVEEGQKAVASASGRPVLTGADKVINVLPLLTIAGDVDINTGHIRFNGDVLIRGNVTEGLLVYATGRVTVLGSVYSALIVSNSGIHINHNVVSSKLHTGGIVAFFNRVNPVLKQLRIHLTGIDTAIKQLKTNKMFQMHDLHIKGDGNLIKLLIDAKFKEIPKIIEDLGDCLKSAVCKLDPSITQFIQLIQMKFIGTGPLTITSIKELDQIRQLLDEVIHQGEECDSGPADVSMGYVQNSVIEVTGSVSIFGKGSYQTDIYAGKNVEISGVCRGGEINAAGNVKVTDLGSGALVLTKIKVKEYGKITASRVFPNVHISAGGQVFKTDCVVQNFKCYWNPNKGLIIDKSKLGGIVNA